jgi:glycosyltransferase involved in cell wall biosynthesis
MLKLCLALPIFYPTFGGGPLRFMRYQPGLRKRDVHARVLAGTGRTKDDFHTDEHLGWSDYSIGSMLPIDHVEGTPVHRVRLPRVTGVLRTSAYFRALISLCRNPVTRPDVIQIHSFERLESLFWLWRLKRLEIPIVYAIQIARPVRHRSRILRWLKKSMLKRFYDIFDGVVTNSESIRSTLLELGVRTPIAVIPNGVDLDRFRRCENDDARAHARNALGISGPGPIILSVGAICPRKGIDLLIEAWTKLQDRHPDAELLLVGPRHDRNNPNLHRFDRRLKALVAASPHPDRVHFTGVRDDMNEVYAVADVVVLASSREGMPNVVLEAMACDRPVLITPFEGQSNIIGRPGIEFGQSERTPAALAQNLAALLDNPDLREDLIRHGRAWIAPNLDVERSLDRFAEFYRLAANGNLSESNLREAQPIHSPPDALPARDLLN